ncbi:MAG: radical SAM protein [archaeon]
MKTVLINPPITSQERYGSIVKDGGGRQAPLGICFVAAVLRKNNFPVSVIDAEGENLTYKDIMERLRNENADIVGITSTTVAFHRSLELAKSIRKFDKNITIIIGGSHVSAMPEMTMKYDCFDIGAYGEAEYTFLELAQKVSNNDDWKNIDGIVYNDNGKIVKTLPRPLIADLDELPYPAIDLLSNLDLYNPPPMNYLNKPVLSVVTSRGCPNQCIFCDHSVFGNKYRYHSAKRIVEEIKHLIKEYGAKEISIVDDNFTVNKNRVYEFCDLMIKNRVKIPWNARISANTVSKDMLKKMREAGCWYLEIGIETGSPKVLKDIKKGTTHDKISEMVKYADELGYHVKGFFMIGHPTDTEKSIRQTIDYAKSIPLTDIVTTIFTPFYNTQAYEEAKTHGRFLYKQDWTKLSTWEVVFVPKGLTKKKLQYYWKQMYREFYFRPITLWRHLKQIRNWTAVKRYLRGAKVAVKLLF